MSDARTLLEATILGEPVPKGRPRVDDAVLVEAYRRLASIYKVGAEVGLSPQTVHDRLVRLGVPRLNTTARAFTEAETERLRREYQLYRDAGALRDLAAQMGRTVPFLCRQARFLGLTDQAHKKPWHGKWKYLSEEAARMLFERFRRQRGTVRGFCRRLKIDDLGFSQTMRRFFPDEWELEVEAHQPRQTKYRLGRQFEYRVRDALRAKGYFVLRSPQSRSPVDLVAIRPGVVLFVQCKRHGAIGVAEWNALYDLAGSVGAWPILAEMPGAHGIRYARLTARKDGSRRAQPMEAFEP